MKRLFTPQWLDPTPVQVPPELRSTIAGSELLLETLVRRGYTDPETAKGFLDPDLYHPANPNDLPDLKKAVERILQALATHQRIGVWGDFDVDGQTSTTVLVSAFRHLGADVIYHIPIRKTESHGILIEPLKEFLGLGVQLLISCDTGISAHDAVDFAQSRGVDVIITDHHSLPPTLPAALAVVNPQRLPEEHPLHSLSGVGAAYEVVLELCNQLSDGDYPATLLDLVALGLVADVATLTADTRYLVQKGLALLQKAPRPAIQKIFSENQVIPALVTEETISFVIAPRMNAVGRLSDANPMVEFLLSDDPVLLDTTYNRIEGLNSQRKILCDQVFKGAQAQLEATPRLLDRPLIMLHHPEWDSGVVGIVASRLVEEYHRPAILMNSSDPLLAKGSCRSIEGVNITEALRQNSNLLRTFGGHPMAAGLSVPTENLTSLQFGLISSIQQMIEANRVEPTLQIDSFTDLSAIDLDFLLDLSRLAPFGPGNPPLRFAAKSLSIESISAIGKTKEHLLVTVQAPNGENFQLVWWQGAGLPQPEGKFDLIFHARANNYKGKVEVQFEWEDFKESAEEETASGNSRKKSRAEQIDLRACESPSQKLIELSHAGNLQVWSEGTSFCPLPSVDRLHLMPNQPLVIWTIPPSPKVLAETIKSVKPQQLYWFGLVPPENELGLLLQQTAKQIKQKSASAIAVDLRLNELAASLSSTNSEISLAVKWLHAKGELTIETSSPDQITIRLQKRVPDLQTAVRLQNELMQVHTEISAYRQFYLRADTLDSLMPTL
jgi:single-stranded-DNA-specific exonuclease RecJ